MTDSDCKDKIRFSLSDRSGALRFEAFDVVDQPDCRHIVDALRQILLHRPLAEIDVAEVERLSCPHGDQCMRAAAKIIRECQGTFLHEG